jgi:hypothetical protein
MGVKDLPLIAGGKDFSLYKEEVSNIYKKIFKAFRIFNVSQTADEPYERFPRKQ